MENRFFILPKFEFYRLFAITIVSSKINSIILFGVYFGKPINFLYDPFHIKWNLFYKDIVYVLIMGAKYMKYGLM
jgi:hypothetical protein